MTLPLAGLAVLSLAGGYIRVPAWLEPMFPRGEAHHDPALVAVSVAAGLAGIGLALWFYVARPGLADRVAASLGGLYRLVYNKYFVDEIYGAAVVRPVVVGSRFVMWRGVDVGLIDGLVNGIGSRARGLGLILRRLQSGYIRSYAAWVLIGCLFLLLSLGLAGGLR